MGPYEDSGYSDGLKKKSHLPAAVQWGGEWNGEGLGKMATL